MRESRTIALAAALVLFTTPSFAQSRAAGCSGRAPFSVTSVGGGKMVVGSADPIERLRAACAPKPYDFVTADSKKLLAGIKLAKAQNDSVVAIRKTYLALQKTVNEQTATQRARSDTVAIATVLAKALDPAPDPREYYLTDQMLALRQQFAAALRAVFTAEQVTRFDANLADLKEKEPG
jgi:hypothetical protein